VNAESGRRAAAEAEPARVRLFVALELPRRVRTALASWRLDALRGVSRLRSLADEQLHVTLCFLGWQDAGEVEGIAAACGLLSDCDPPALVLGQPLWLPARRPRALAVRLDDSLARLGAIQATLSAQLRDGGWYEPEARAFLPHVTVARAGRQGRVSARPLASPPPLSFTGSWVTLFRSRLSPQGARYEPLTRVRLGAPVSRA
jgi:2'-5' RNA ligase